MAAKCLHGNSPELYSATRGKCTWWTSYYTTWQFQSSNSDCCQIFCAWLFMPLFSRLHIGCPSQMYSNHHTTLPPMGRQTRHPRFCHITRPPRHVTLGSVHTADLWHTMSRGEKREGSKRERESERGGRKGSFVKWFHWRRVSTADSSEIRFLIGETKFSLQQICCNASGKEFLLGFCERVFPKMGFVVGTCGLGLGLVN